MNRVVFVLMLMGWNLAGAVLATEPSPTHPADAPPPEAAKYVLELKDGTRLIGTPDQSGPMVVQAEFGSVEIPFHLIRLIDFLPGGKRTRIGFQNGDVLTANMAIQTLPFQTSYGVLSIPADQITRMAIEAPEEEKIARNSAPPAPSGTIQHVSFSVPLGLAPPPPDLPKAPPAE